jgi:hypothetical protein
LRCGSGFWSAFSENYSRGIIIAISRRIKVRIEDLPFHSEINDSEMIHAYLSIRKWELGISQDLVTIVGIFITGKLAGRKE